MTSLYTERLLLRPPELRDVPAITVLLGDYDVAKNLATAPHPYSEADASEFVKRVTEKRALGEGYCYAIESRQDAVFVGTCGLTVKNGKLELGYWIGKPYWGRGYATEAAGRLVGFALKELKAASIRAGWYHDNPASGRVLEKVGFVPDGAEPRNSLARGHAVYCHMVTLTREEFGRRKAA